jgi:hypothetical protein
MNPLFTTYTGNGYDATILEARRQNPDHQGNVIAIPKGRLEWLLRAEKGFKNNEDTQWQARN